MASCISGFKNVCRRVKAFASQLLSLQRIWHLTSKNQVPFLQATDFRTAILSSQYRFVSRNEWEKVVSLENGCDELFDLHVSLYRHGYLMVYSRVVERSKYDDNLPFLRCLRHCQPSAGNLLHDLRRANRGQDVRFW